MKQCLTCGELFVTERDRQDLATTGGRTFHVVSQHHLSCDGNCTGDCPVPDECGPVVGVHAPLGREGRGRVARARERLLDTHPVVMHWTAPAAGLAELRAALLQASAAISKLTPALIRDVEPPPDHPNCRCEP